MSPQDEDDLMPRPLPKPSQVEIVSVQSEVSEPSLIIDKCYSQTKSNDYVLNSFKSSSISNSSLSRNAYTQNYNSVQQKHTEIPISTSSYSPAVQNQVDLHSGCRKVSFSPLSNDRHQTKSTNQIHQMYDYCKNSFKPESCSCQCNSHELESDLRSDTKLHSPSVCADFTRKKHRIPSDYEYPMQNEMCNRKRCSCAACTKEYFDGLTSKEQKQSFISAEELQKTVLKFENLFLKLNYKYSKITENFVSKEELSAVTRSYEAKIDSMQAVIDAIIAKNNTNHCNYCNQPRPNYKSQEQTGNPVTMKSNSPVCTEKCDSLPYNNYNRNIISESDPPNNDAFDSIKCVRKREDFRHSCEPQICHTKALETQKRCTNVTEDQLKHTHSPTDKFWSSRRNGCNEEFENRNHISVTRPKEASNLQDHLRLVSTENKSKFCESNGHQEHEKETIIGNLKDDQQLKFLYNNVITQVKSMLEKNIPVGVYGKTDPMQFVREATIEQFEKMGLNVKNVIDEDKERNFQRIQSHDNEEAKRTSVPNTNMVPSSDVSLHMNALAMKYISNYQKDENDSTEKKSKMNDVSVNCNNVSIATLRYLERHQILSDLDKPHLGFGANEIASSTQRFHTMESDHNTDRSFIR